MALVNVNSGNEEGMPSGGSGGGSGGSGSPSGSGGGGGKKDKNPAQEARQGAFRDMMEFNPWLKMLGLGSFIRQLIRDGAPGSEILQAVRQTNQYKRMFPGIVRADGTRPWTESEYLARTEDYRNVLRQFGMWKASQDSPMDYVSFFDLGVDPNELQERLVRYRTLQRSSQATKDAFFVYAGMDVDDDTLYKAMVNPTFRQALQLQYNERVAGGEFTYNKFIRRATQQGLKRVAKLLKDMQTQGLVTGQVISKLMTVDPDFAQKIMGSLFQGGQKHAGRMLDLDELMSSFDFAILGSAAREAGLELPTKQRIQALVQSGISRAQAARSWAQFSSTRGLLQGAAQRAGLDGFSQDLWEEATLLARGDAVTKLNRVIGGENALGQEGTGFASDLEGGRITQRGRAL